MKDEEYLFRQDVKEKKHTAQSARHARKTHTGKGGRVKLPSDYMTRKELNAMNGECKSYRLNDPMKWNEFKTMPDDVKIIYIKRIRDKWNAPDIEIAQMLGVCKATIVRAIADLGLSKGKNFNKKERWDKEGFYAWVHGTPEITHEAPEEAENDAVNEVANATETEQPMLAEAFEHHPVNEESVTPEELARPFIAIPNEYEMEYHKLMEVNAKLRAELEYVKNEKESMEIELVRMRAQLDMVYLIFGRK